MFASHTVVSANGSGGSPQCRASTTTTGVSSTAVVSSDKKIVQRQASTTVASQSAHVRPRPRPAARSAIQVKSPASLAS